MSVITGNGATYPTSFEGPDDGDPRAADDINAALEALADRTENLRGRLEGAPGFVEVHNLEVTNDALIHDALDVLGHTTLNTMAVSGNATIPNVSGNLTASGIVSAAQANISGQINGNAVLSTTGYFVPTRTVTIAIDGPVEAESGWGVVHLGNNIRWETTAADANARFLRVCLNQYIPPNASITQVVARYRGALGHSELPGTMPELVLYRKQIGTAGAGSGNVGAAFDPSANTTAYQAEHDIPLVLGSPYTPDTSTGSIYAILWSEADADDNAIVGAWFLGLLVTFTFSRIDRAS